MVGKTSENEFFKLSWPTLDLEAIYIIKYVRVKGWVGGRTLCSINLYILQHWGKHTVTKDQKHPYSIIERPLR